MPQRRRNGNRMRGAGGSGGHAPPPSAAGSSPTHSLYACAVAPTAAMGLAMGSRDNYAAGGTYQYAAVRMNNDPQQLLLPDTPPVPDDYWASSLGSSSQHGSALGGVPGTPLEAPEYADIPMWTPRTVPLPSRLLRAPDPAPATPQQSTQQHQQHLQHQQEADWPFTNAREGRIVPDGAPSKWLNDPSSAGQGGEAQGQGGPGASDSGGYSTCGGAGSYLRDQRGSDIDAIRQHVTALEQARQADLDTLRGQVATIAQQAATIAQKAAANAQAEEKLAVVEAALRSKERELLRYHGQSEALRGMSAAELAGLGEGITEALTRVQGEQQRKFTKLSDEQLCVVCLSERKDVVLRPCNHLTMCVRCFRKCNRVCPQCRAPVIGHLKVYN